jgi:hypothetical protein
VSVKQVITAPYKVPSGAIRNAFEALSKVNDERLKFKQTALVESQERRQVYPWMR